MKLLLLVVWCWALCLSCVKATNVTLSLQEPPPYYANRTYSVNWSISREEKDETEGRFWIVKDRQPNTLGDDPTEVGIPGELKASLTRTGVAKVKFFFPGATYDLVAFDKRIGDKGSQYEGEFGRIRNILVLDPNDPQPPPAPTQASPALPTEPLSNPADSNPKPSVIPGEPKLTQPGDTTQGAEELKNGTIAKASNTAIIVGSVLGSAIALCIIVILVYLFVIRPRRRKREYAAQLGIFIKSPGTSKPESGFEFVKSPLESWYDEKMRRQASNASSISSVGPLRGSHGMRGSEVESRRTVSTFPSIFTDATPPVRLRPLTDRQMDLQEQVQTLKGQLIQLDEDSPEFEELMKRISILEHLQESDWALDRTDNIPPGLV